jgi:transposase
MNPAKEGIPAMAKRKKSTYERLRNGEKLKQWERKELERQFQAEDPGWEVVHGNVAGIDVGNESHFAAVDPKMTPQSVREFGSWTAGLQEMADWLKQCGVKRVVMQTTGVYWIAVQEMMERNGLQVAVVDARGTKNLPGRKSDVQECQWLRKLDRFGLLRESFQTPEAIRGIRTTWRLRQRWVSDAGRSIQQMQKALTTMNVQLANAISDVSGVTGLAIIRAIVKGERDPWKLAKLRDKRIRASEEEIARSLEGNWREDVLFELGEVLEAYDFQQKRIAKCDEQLKKHMGEQPTREVGSGVEVVVEEVGVGSKKRKKKEQRKPRKNQPAFDLEAELKRVMGVDLTRIDGVKVMTVQTIYAEVGADLSAFATEGHFASWLMLAPKRDVSGGKVIKHLTYNGSNRVANSLKMGAESLKDSDSYLGARYRTLRGRLGGVRAVKAMARYLACLIYRMLTKGEAYVDRGAAYFEKKRQDRDMVYLQRKAAALGMQLIAAV